ncbi:MAG: methyltransferase domain-containing protein [Clostridia bacterium]|nr:methyltransferase domain-containing protein [Clostridia bacterium]
MSFICPNCGEKLNKDVRRLVCSRGHSFDRAKEGYYNLLLSAGGVHGDNKEMVLSRRLFLSRGFYEKMAIKLSETVLKMTPNKGVVLDSGSGEGYYTDIIEVELFSRDGDSNVYAFDISKDAVKYATKRNQRINYAVASAYRQPFEDCSFDTAYNVFSPLALGEIKRVLREKGIFIMVIPDELHLFELKQAIYETPYKNKLDDTAIEGFELISNEPVHYKIELSTKEDITALFNMTPYAYRTSKNDADKVMCLDRITVSANFRIITYRKV